MTLLGSVVVLVAVGAIFAALTGRATWQSITWALILGGGFVVVVNVAGSGSDRAAVDYRTGFAFGGTVRDATTSAGWFIVGLVLVGLGIVGLIA